MTTITNNTIAEAIYLALRDKTHHEQEDIIHRIIDFLSRRRLLSKASLIISQLEKIINKAEGKLSVRVHSAIKLEEKTKISLLHSLKHRYSVKEITLEEVLNQKLLGGVKLEINDEVIDLTLKNRMNKLQEHLIK